jgi:hypothetical protein
MVMKMTFLIRTFRRLLRRERFAAEHQFVMWMRFSCRHVATGPKSPQIGYAAAKNQSMPWPKEALRTGWFPQLLVENMTAITSEELRREFVVT